MPVDRARERLHELVDAVLLGGNVVIVVEREGETRYVQMVAVPQDEPRRAVFGSTRGLVTMSDDFDAPIEYFDDYQCPPSSSTRKA